MDRARRTPGQPSVCSGSGRARAGGRILYGSARTALRRPIVNPVHHPEDRSARTASVRAGLHRLHRAGADGTLARRCAELGVDLVTLHGSAAAGMDDPQDLDLGVLFATDALARRNLVEMVTVLAELAGTDLVDVMDVRRASPTARARAVAHASEVLFEARPGVATRQQMAALTLELELEPLRRAQLELLASR